MEKLNYREIVQKVLENHAKNRSHSQTEVKLIFDYRTRIAIKF